MQLFFCLTFSNARKLEIVLPDRSKRSNQLHCCHIVFRDSVLKGDIPPDRVLLEADPELFSDGSRSELSRQPDRFEVFEGRDRVQLELSVADRDLASERVLFSIANKLDLSSPGIGRLEAEFE